MQSQKRFRAIGVIALFAAFTSGCATIQTGSHFDETTDFSAYHSFSWIDEDPYITGDAVTLVSPLAQEQIKDAIRNELERLGYAFTDDRGNADFVVSFTVGAREQIRVESYPVQYRGYWGWHVPYSVYYYREVQTHSYTRGTLGVDIFDNESGKPVWHGWAEKTVTQSDREDPSKSITEGVASLFEKFPG